MPDLIPCFGSHYSFAHDSLLTLEEAGKTSDGNPRSIVDIAREHHLKQIVLVDSRIDGFLEAHRNLSKPFKPTSPKTYDEYLRDESGDKEITDNHRAAAQAALDAARLRYERQSKWSRDPIQLIYGLKLCVCADMLDKSDESVKTESNVIVFVKNTQGYSDLLRIQSRTWTDGFHRHGRSDWRQLKDLWTDNLTLSLPFFSSFAARNLLSMSNIVPDFPVKPTVFREVDSGLPFAPLIDDAITQFAGAQGLSVQDVKTVYYEDGDRDYDPYVTFRAIGNRAEYSRPQVDHLASNRFSFKEWLRLSGGGS